MYRLRCHPLRERIVLSKRVKCSYGEYGLRTVVIVMVFEIFTEQTQIGLLVNSGCKM